MIFSTFLVFAVFFTFAQGNRTLPREAVLLDDPTAVEFGRVRDFNFSPYSWSDAKQMRVCYATQHDTPDTFTPPASLLTFVGKEKLEILLQFEEINKGSKPRRFCASVSPCEFWNELYYMEERLGGNAKVGFEALMVDSKIDMPTLTLDMAGFHATTDMLVSGENYRIPLWGGVLTSPLSSCTLDGCTPALSGGRYVDSKDFSVATHIVVHDSDNAAPRCVAVEGTTMPSLHEGPDVSPNATQQVLGRLDTISFKYIKPDNGKVPDSIVVHHDMSIKLLRRLSK